MKKLSQEQISQSEQFLWMSARLLERVRFERLFGDGPIEPVLAVLRGYQNRDGGFGQAIEPDFRGPISQPLGVDFALRVLDELERPEPSILEPALRYLVQITAADGGVPNVAPQTGTYPRAPWWQPAEGSPGSLLPTAALVGFLFKLGVQHAWLERASHFSWTALDGLLKRAKEARDRIERIGVAYQARATLAFLEYTPERAKAERAAADLRRVLTHAALIDVGEDMKAETMHALDYAPHPDSLARRWFDDAVIDRQLDALIEARAADGGWTVPWLIWAPVCEYEWRGVLTVERLKTLRAYGRFA